jgi:hypothetical protein
VKVKFFGFGLTIKGKGVVGGSLHVDNADEIETAINEWLAGRPGIRIAHVQQTATGASGLGHQFLYVTVWYEEDAAR